MFVYCFVYVNVVKKVLRRYALSKCLKLNEKGHRLSTAYRWN